jgi:hypothetical protein
MNILNVKKGCIEGVAKVGPGKYAPLADGYKCLIGPYEEKVAHLRLRRLIRIIVA